jgi:hypothetical protein
MTRISEECANLRTFFHPRTNATASRFEVFEFEKTCFPPEAGASDNPQVFRLELMSAGFE